MINKKSRARYHRSLKLGSKLKYINIVYKIDSNDCEAVYFFYFSAFKRLLKSWLDELSKIAIPKLRSTVGKMILTLAVQSLGKWKKLQILWWFLFTLSKRPTCLLKFGFLIYGSPHLLFLFYTFRFGQMKLTQTLHFCVCMS